MENSDSAVTANTQPEESKEAPTSQPQFLNHLNDQYKAPPQASGYQPQSLNGWNQQNGLYGGYQQFPVQNQPQQQVFQQQAAIQPQIPQIAPVAQVQQQLPVNYQRTFSNFQQPQQQQQYPGFPVPQQQQQYNPYPTPQQQYQQPQQYGQPVYPQQGGYQQPFYPQPQQQQYLNNGLDTYRLKLFRDILDRRYETVLKGEDLSKYKHVDQTYNLGFWACMASIPVNFYYGLQIGKIPARAKTFMFRSLAYTTFSTILFGMSIFRYQDITKEMSTRYLTNMSNQEMQEYVNQLKYPHMQANPYGPPSPHAQMMIPQMQQQQQMMYRPTPPPLQQLPQEQVSYQQQLPVPTPQAVQQPAQQAAETPAIPVNVIPASQNPYGLTGAAQVGKANPVVHKNSNPYI